MTGPQDPQDPNYPAYGSDVPPPPPPPQGYGYGPPPPGYGPPPPGYQPMPAAGAPVRVRRAWPPRINERPDPKFGVSLAGIGVGLAVVGVIVWGGDYLGTSSGGGSGVSDSHRLLGIALSLVAIALGYALAIRFRTGPLTTAGVVASAVGVPVLMGFLTFDPASSDGPFQVDAIALVSIAAWVVSYFWVRGTRGHSFFLGAAAIVLWVYLLDKTDSGLFSLSRLVTPLLPFSGESGFRGPDWNTIGGLSLTFGIGYYVAMVVLDQSGRRGAGTPFAISGFVATVAGILAFSPHTHTKGTAALFAAFGVVLAWVGARSARRFTTWIWMFAVGAGLVVLIGDSLSDNNAAAGIVLILIGVVLVAVAALYAARVGEPADDPLEAV